MSKVTLFSRLLALALVLFLPACGISTDRSEEGGTSQQPKRGPDGQALVTLKPPYERWSWSRDKEELSVQNAMSAICTQAGFKYNHHKSFVNTDPVCRSWTYPDFEDKPWKEAIEEILAPFNLAYVLENNNVVLMKVEDAKNWAENVKRSNAAIERFLSLEEQPPGSRDAVVIFPLLDDSGKTTELGTLLSLLGMLRATYTPKKVLNMHFPSIDDLYHHCHYDEPGRTVSADEKNRIKARLCAGSSATGTLEIAQDGAFEIALEFEGERGARKFHIAGTGDELAGIPCRLAECVHEYLGTTLSPAENEYLNSPNLRGTDDLPNLLELEIDYRLGRNNPTPWRHLLKHNPDSAFAIYRYYLLCGRNQQDDSLNYISLALKTRGDHQLLRFIEAQWYQRSEKYAHSISRFAELLEDDPRNGALYAELDDGLIALGFGERAERLHLKWTEHDAGCYLPLLALGDFYMGYARAVGEESGGAFEKRLLLAEEYLGRAYELNPSDPRAPAALIKVCEGLRRERQEMEKWFKRAIEADIGCYCAYKNKLSYLMAKWRGSTDEMFAFARDCAANPPGGSRVSLILVDAHYEMARRSAEKGGNWRDYYQDPKIYDEIKAVYRNYLRENPYSMWDRNYFAKYAFYARDYEEAVRQFKFIGTEIEKKCWGPRSYFGSEKYFYECRKKAYAGLAKARPASKYQQP